MWRSSFFYSIFLHAVILLALVISIPDWKSPDEKNQSVPILIDLKNLKIAEKTNLPAKGERTEIKQSVQKSAPVPKKVETVVPVKKDTPRPESKALLDKIPPVKSKPKPAVKPVVKPVSKPTTKPQKKSDENDMEQLLASVEKMGQNLKKTPQPTSVKGKTEGQEKGVKGGVSSDEEEALMISQIDFIATTVRKYWNRDPGIEGAENMKIDLRVSLNPNGRVEAVEILNQARYHSDAGYHSMADRAKRAIYICDKLEQESPFVILAEKFPGKFESWRKIVFNFNPLDN